MTVYFAMLISAVCSYLLGGANGAIIFSHLIHHEDIREKGSKNPGFTNYKRVYGNDIIAWIVLIFDVGKAAVCVFLTALFFRNNYDMWQFGAAFAGLFAMLGHCFPLWYGFKGGKAFMAGFATIWFVDYRMALIATLIFFIVLASCRYMSVSSCTASLTCPVALLCLMICDRTFDIKVWLLCLFSALLVIIRHKSNFEKLKNHTESNFSLKNK